MVSLEFLDDAVIVVVSAGTYDDTFSSAISIFKSKLLLSLLTFFTSETEVSKNTDISTTTD